MCLNGAHTESFELRLPSSTVRFVGSGKGR